MMKFVIFLALIAVALAAPTSVHDEKIKGAIPLPPVPGLIPVPIASKTIDLHNAGAYLGKLYAFVAYPLDTFKSSDQPAVYTGYGSSTSQTPFFEIPNVWDYFNFHKSDE